MCAPSKHGNWSPRSRQHWELGSDLLCLMKQL